MRLYVTISPACLIPRGRHRRHHAVLVCYALHDAMLSPCRTTPWPPAWRSPGGEPTSASTSLNCVRG